MSYLTLCRHEIIKLYELYHIGDPDVMDEALNTPLPEEDNARAEIAPIHFKPVPYWPRSPDSWFIALEAQFTVNRISSDATQFYLTLQSLDEKAIQACRDVITHPPAAGKYEALKHAVLSRLCESDDSRLSRVLYDLNLGDHKPSELFREMQNLSDGKIPLPILRKLWMQRLPVNIQAILMVSTEGMDVITRLADKIDDTLKPTACTAISTISPPQSIMSSDLTALKQEVNDMQAELAAIRKKEIPGTDARHGPRKLARENCPRHFSRQQTPRECAPKQICWYHKKFGKNANRCTSPCFYTENESGSEH